MRTSRIFLSALFALGGLIAAALIASLNPFALARSPGERTAEPQPALLLMTGLPIVWGEGDIGETLRGERGPAQSYRWLDAHFRLTVLDGIDAKALAGQRLLLLAQPRALAPEELVALDAWVRRGGRALILADPSLRWPSRYPIGDPRAPPAMSLLDPLLGHWGLRLDLVHLDLRRGNDETVMVPVAGRHWKLRMAAPGRFALTGKACAIEQQGLIARCAIGRGKALLLADADLMDDALWMGDGPDGGSPEKRVADNPMFIAGLLDQLSGISRDGAAVRIPLAGVSGRASGALLLAFLLGFTALVLAIAMAFLGRDRRG